MREWLKELDEAERHAIGKDLLQAQWRWSVGMPLLPSLAKTDSGKCEQTCRPNGRRACWLPLLRHLVALHGFIKKTRATPDEDLATARKRKKELEQ